MYVVCVTVWVKPGREDEFVAATLENARASRGEPGNLRFDLLNHAEEPGRYFLYEVYRDESDFMDHQKTPHYLKWREAVTDWMARKREGVRHHSIFPDDESAWRAG
jgi:autoinducer 2-degrading protein